MGPTLRTLAVLAALFAVVGAINKAPGTAMTSLVAVSLAAVCFGYWFDVRDRHPRTDDRQQAVPPPPVGSAYWR